MGKKCLVIGGDGFLGSHLVDDLVLRGFDVRVFDRFQNEQIKNIKHLEGKVELYAGDFLNEHHLSRALRGIEYVFHFVSLSTPSSTANDLHTEMELNAKGTLRLLDLCVKHHVKKIIYPSSGGTVYGNALEAVASETTQLRPISPYAVTKVIVEEYLHFYKRQYGLDFVIYRIANPYGDRQNPQGTQGAIAILMNQMMKDETLHIYGDTVRDYIYVKDVTSFIAGNFDQKQKKSTYNIGSGRGTTLSEIVQMLVKMTHSVPRIQKSEKRPFDVQKIVLDISRAEAEFDFHPSMSLEEGLYKTYTSLKGKETQDTPQPISWLKRIVWNI